MEKAYVYKHTTPNGKVYIGITTQKPEDRWREGIGYRTQKLFYRAIQKYGWENIQHEIICVVDSYEEACELEREYIAKFRSNEKEYGYNTTLGGEGTLGFRHSDETKHQMSETMKKKQSTLEVKKRVSEEAKERWKDDEFRSMMAAQSSIRQKQYYSTHSHRGSALDRTGYHHSEDNKAKMSEIKKKQIADDPEYKKRILSALEKARRVPKKNNPPKGADHKRSKPVRCVETGIVYVNAREAYRKTGIHYNSISLAANHKRIHIAGGYHWEFVNLD